MRSRAYLWSTIGLLCFILYVGEALGQEELWDRHMEAAKDAYAKSKYMEAEQHALAAIEAPELSLLTVHAARSGGLVLRFQRLFPTVDLLGGHTGDRRLLGPFDLCKCTILATEPIVCNVS